MARSRRGALLTICTVLFVIVAISDFAKPLQWGKDIGFVFLGTRLSGVPNLIIGPIFGVFLAVYAFAIWRMRRLALPMGIAYAAYVILNLILYSAKTASAQNESAIFAVAYIVVAVGVSSGAALLLYRRRADLT